MFAFRVFNVLCRPRTFAYLLQFNAIHIADRIYKNENCVLLISGVLTKASGVELNTKKHEHVIYFAWFFVDGSIFHTHTVFIGPLSIYRFNET